MRAFSIAAFALVLAACRLAVPVESVTPRGVILISIDTLRADRVGAWGGPPRATPWLDQLAAESVVFSQAFAHAPSTLPSHASLFTSQTPDQHGAFFARRAGLPEDVTSISQSFLAAGWSTAAFHNGGQMAPAWGLGKGFETYSRVRQNRLAAVGRHGVEWIDELPPDRSFFLFLHTYHVHAPYEPDHHDLVRFRDPGYDGRLPDRLSTKQIQQHNEQGDLRPEDFEHVANLYHAEIRAMDRDLGLLLARLRARGLLDETILILLSDHGEELGERGQTGWHAHSLYDELLHVPLLVRFPDQRGAGARIDQLVGLIDVAPTLLDLLGFPRPESFSGTSLLPLLNGAGEHRPYVVAVRDEASDDPLIAVRTQRFKLIGDALFDLEMDPGERENVAALHPQIIAELRAQLLARPELEPTPAIELDDELRGELEALGYL